jgi:hypothetical protein
MTTNLAYDLRRETEAAYTLLANIRDVIADDAQAVADAVEGETNLMEVIATAVARIQELEAHCVALTEQTKTLAERKARFERQGEHLRAAVLVAMGQVDLKKIELPTATLSRKAVPLKCEIVNPADIPSHFWIPAEPKLDRKALLEALKAKQPVPGAELTNGGETLAIRGN